MQVIAKPIGNRQFLTPPSQGTLRRVRTLRPKRPRRRVLSAPQFSMADKRTLSKLALMAATGEMHVLLSPFGVLHYLHGTTAKADFLERYRNSKVTTHDLKVLLRSSGSSNLLGGHDKSHMGGWIRYKPDRPPALWQRHARLLLWRPVRCSALPSASALVGWAGGQGDGHVRRRSPLPARARQASRWRQAEARRDAQAARQNQGKLGGRGWA